MSGFFRYKIYFREMQDDIIKLTGVSLVRHVVYSKSNMSKINIPYKIKDMEKFLAEAFSTLREYYHWDYSIIKDGRYTLQEGLFSDYGVRISRFSDIRIGDLVKVKGEECKLDSVEYCKRSDFYNVYVTTNKYIKEYNERQRIINEYEELAKDLIFITGEFHKTSNGDMLEYVIEPRSIYGNNEYKGSLIKI